MELTWLGGGSVQAATMGRALDLTHSAMRAREAAPTGTDVGRGIPGSAKALNHGVTHVATPMHYLPSLLRGQACNVASAFESVEA